MYDCFCPHVCTLRMCLVSSTYLLRPEEGIRLPETGIREDCESPCGFWERGTLVFCKSSKCSYPLRYLSTVIPRPPFFCILVYFVWGRISQCSCGWPGTPHRPAIHQPPPPECRKLKNELRQTSSSFCMFWWVFYGRVCWMHACNANIWEAKRQDCKCEVSLCYVMRRCQKEKGFIYLDVESF